LSRGIKGRTKFAWETARLAFEPLAGEPQKPELVRPGELGVTFIGHSSFLIQMAGKNILVDPVFAKWLIVLRRVRRPGVEVQDLPPIDLVLQTHAHMDHLNFPSLRAIVDHTRSIRGKAPEIIVPHGVDDLVAPLGFARIHTMRWWQQFTSGALRIVMTPSQHWGKRFFVDDHRGYGGYVLESGSHSIYHSGDTAYFSGFQQIARLHPKLALLPIGAYSPDSFRSVHTTPEDALQAFLDLGSDCMIPMHYGTFRLSKEPIDEPLPRLLAAAQHAKVADRITTLREGETLLLSNRPSAQPSADPAGQMIHS
jgi:L-ascorbate metabolism protein UlaG (beta-lactamase superfamily)